MQSHDEYLHTLQPPSLEETRRISQIQVEREQAIDHRYRTSDEEVDAAARIQKAYRGHRVRRQLEGLTLSPTARWNDLVKEWRLRSVTTSPMLESNARPPLLDARSRTLPDARAKWEKAGVIAERASAGGPNVEELESVPTSPQRSDFQGAGPETMMMDLRYFLEMVDVQHRYGANLQVYHAEWLRHKDNDNFFHWLDHGAGKVLDLPGCSRVKLDHEKIRYLTRDERRDYLVRIDDQGKLRWAKNDDLITTSIEDFVDSKQGIVRRSSVADASVGGAAPDDISGAASPVDSVSPVGTPGLDEGLPSPKSPTETPTHSNNNNKRNPKPRLLASPATILNALFRASVRPGTWIYVADTLGRLYLGIKTSGAFQHASFLSGARISSAGSISVEAGTITYLSPLSGHYRPTTKSYRDFVAGLQARGADVSRIRRSHAYELLRGMEVYGKAKGGLKRGIPSHDAEEKRWLRYRAEHDKREMLTATGLVDDSWDQTRNGKTGLLVRMADGLHLSKKPAS